MEDGKRVFVTVGTTKFDELVQSVTQRNVLEALFSKGYTSMTIQIGNGLFVPNEGIRHGIVISAFRFKDSILENFENSELVISHAGAGSCLEALEIGKPLITVVNDKLMHNHQLELAEALAGEDLCAWCLPNNLCDVLEQFDSLNLKPYTKGSPRDLINYIDYCFVVKNK